MTPSTKQTLGEIESDLADVISQYKETMSPVITDTELSVLNKLLRLKVRVFELKEACNG